MEQVICNQAKGCTLCTGCYHLKPHTFMRGLCAEAVCAPTGKVAKCVPEGLSQETRAEG